MERRNPGLTDSFNVDNDWLPLLSDQVQATYFLQLSEFLRSERQRHKIFPTASNTFRAFHSTPFKKVRFVMLGQDPYHDQDQAHGLSFSVPNGVSPPPSLRNIYKELETDLNCPVPLSGDLSHWARQGGFLLNSVLTVRAHQPGSHRNRGWETFTDAAIRLLNEKPDPVVFVLWGKDAQKKRKLINAARHHIIASAHPSPLSAYRGFFGSRPFSRINQVLTGHGFSPINWNGNESGICKP